MTTFPYWKRLRILANPVRLEMLTLVAGHPRQCVKTIGGQMGLPEESASKHLQQLAEGGFLLPEREGRFLYYSPSRDPLAKSCLDEIKRDGTDIGSMLYSLTAFTHERRILIVRKLAPLPLGAAALGIKTGISKDALSRHLDKLARRDVVQRAEGVWELKKPRNRFARVLLEWALG